MSDAPVVDVDSLRAQEASQREHVRTLKKEGKKDALPEAIAQLQKLKLSLSEAEKDLAGPQIDREALEVVLRRRMIVVPSFEIHGGVAGFFDFGPPGAALKDNILTEWKKHFILEENMLQVECTCLTPSVVLETSGHVERFTDLVCKDHTTGECFRADKLLEDHIEAILANTKEPVTLDRRQELELIFRQADAFTPAELSVHFKALEIRSPTTDTELSEPIPFNLMFGTMIGPEGTLQGFLRPETAQGIFVNFRRLLEFNNGKTPFAAAQIGLGFRNEIRPAKGLLRVREFTMAEIEHFVHPERKEHPKFNTVKDVVLTLFPQGNQMTDGKTKQMSIGDATTQGLVNNETLGYFMARTHLFLEKIGVDITRLRFRQHLKTEMAHYACDCWDAEIQMSYGWIECVGHADRACFDLKTHSIKTNVELKASRVLDEPRFVDVAQPKLNRGIIGKLFKKEAKDVLAALEALSCDAAMAFEAELAANGEALLAGADNAKITRVMVSFTKVVKKIEEESFYPSVVEPSFGIGRIVYAVLEHSFYSRADEAEEAAAPAAAAAAADDKKKKKKENKKGSVERTVFSFPARVAPFKCAVLPLMKKDELDTLADELCRRLREMDVSNTTDRSGVAIGRKYARTDEIGVAFAMTVDLDALEGKGITVRERDSQEQIRVPIDAALTIVAELSSGRTTWAQVREANGLI